MKITNTRKINERIKQYIDRQELNALIGMNVGETFSLNLKFENPRELETFAQDFRDDLARDGLELFFTLSAYLFNTIFFIKVMTFYFNSLFKFL